MDKIVVNPNIDSNALLMAIDKNDGYCLCQVPKSEDTKCPCLSFRTKQFGEDWCYCNLYKLEVSNEN